ncbi:MAG: YabP/YqfC family sporulation protein [Lachnospiraceae bacterium]|nr:YabP/YqfC family sporulation protein [Lachnospiraceae bacterium]
MAKYKVHRGGKRKIHKELYREVKRTEKREKKEYTDFFDRLTESVSLTDDVAGEMMVYLAGRHCMLVRNFTSVTEYTACRIRLKTKQYELCVEGEYLRLEYFLPEELRIIGNIVSVSYRS